MNLTRHRLTGNKHQGELTSTQFIPHSFSAQLNASLHDKVASKIHNMLNKNTIP